MTWPEDVSTTRAALQGLRHTRPDTDRTTAEEAELALIDHVQDLLTDLVAGHARADRTMDCPEHGESHVGQLDVRVRAKCGAGRASWLGVLVRCPTTADQPWHVTRIALQHPTPCSEPRSYPQELADALVRSLSTPAGTALRQRALTAALDEGIASHVEQALGRLTQVLAMQVERAACAGTIDASTLATVEALLADRGEQLRASGDPAGSLLDVLDVHDALHS